MACAPYLRPIEGNTGEDCLRDACSLQLFPHAVVDVAGYVCLSHRRPRWRLVLQPGYRRSACVTVYLLRDRAIRQFGEDFSRSPSSWRMVEVLLRRRGDALTSQHAANSILLVEKLGHHKLLVDHLGAEGLWYQPVGVQAEGGAATDVGYFPSREEEGGALVCWATCDWLLGEGHVWRLLREAVHLCGRRRKHINTSARPPNGS